MQQSLKSGFTQLLDEKEFDALIASGHPLRVKAGFDPTAPDLHLGHAVLLKKMREFQDAGHTIVMIVGNTTASIGDPTGRNQLRPALSDDEINTNAWSYMTQAFKILDRTKTVVKKNAEWFDEMKMQDVIRLMSHFTLSQIGGRDDFKERKVTNTPVFMHEMLYPMLQAYDSFREGVDIELGGNDQFYNMLMGRMYMHDRGEKPQVIATVPLLFGTDGRKMSKSFGNHIGLLDEPFEMFSKVMSIADDVMRQWQEVLFPNKCGWHPQPFQSKKYLAWRIVHWLHDEPKADTAEIEWTKRFSDREAPVDIPVVRIPVFHSVNTRLDRVLVLMGLASSVSEGSRLVKSGAVNVNGSVVIDPRLKEPLPEMSVIRVGRKWLKITQS